MFGNVYRDMLFLMVMGFGFLVIMMLPFIHPPTLDDNTDPPGNMVVVMEWPPGPSDVDLWVTGPGEAKPIGYSRKSGVLWNLLRDDLGTTPDATPSNFENAFTRGLVPGEYVINVHCYRCPYGDVPVTIEVSIKKPDTLVGQHTIKIVAFTKMVMRQKEEVTAIRFVLDDKGNIIRSSVNNIYRELRSKNARDQERD